MHPALDCQTFQPGHLFVRRRECHADDRPKLCPRLSGVSIELLIHCDWLHQSHSWEFDSVFDRRAYVGIADRDKGRELRCEEYISS